MYQKITQEMLTLEELKNCTTWEQYQWCLLWLRLLRQHRECGVLV